jgi:hypothetical protein
MKQLCITVQEAQWGDLNMSSDTNLHAGTLMTSRGQSSHRKHSLSPMARAWPQMNFSFL